MISNVFRDLDAVSPYDIVRVLAKLSQGPNVTIALGSYVTKTMKMFRKFVRESKFAEYDKVTWRLCDVRDSVQLVIN